MMKKSDMLPLFSVSIQSFGLGFAIGDGNCNMQAVMVAVLLILAIIVAMLRIRMCDYE